jgi:hypothetical protein
MQAEDRRGAHGPVRQYGRLIDGFWDPLPPGTGGGCWDRKKRRVGAGAVIIPGAKMAG